MAKIFICFCYLKICSLFYFAIVTCDGHSWGWRKRRFTWSFCHNIFNEDSSYHAASTLNIHSCQVISIHVMRICIALYHLRHACNITYTVPSHRNSHFCHLCHLPWSADARDIILTRNIDDEAGRHRPWTQHQVSIYAWSRALMPTCSFEKKSDQKNSIPSLWATMVKDEFG